MATTTTRPNAAQRRSILTAFVVDWDLEEVPLHAFGESAFVCWFGPGQYYVMPYSDQRPYWTNQPLFAMPELLTPEQLHRYRSSYGPCTSRARCFGQCLQHAGEQVADLPEVVDAEEEQHTQ